MNRIPLDHRAAMHEWGSFLSSFHWQVFATATFKHPVSASYGARAAREWINRLGSGAYAYVGHERGEVGHRVHCHALVGGLFRSGQGRDQLGLERQAAHEQVRRAWPHGDIDVQPYNPRRGAAFS